jgi:hypothetical protein
MRHRKVDPFLDPWDLTRPGGLTYAGANMLVAAHRAAGKSPEETLEQKCGATPFV